MIKPPLEGGTQIEGVSEQRRRGEHLDLRENVTGEWTEERKF
jgi:hypothetical protein